MEKEKLILIDGKYPEEIRVAVIEDGLLQEFFRFSESDKEPVRGNIYMGKVASIEQSLQAVFVNYGAEKNGFLSIDDIHPDYFKRRIISKKKDNDILEIDFSESKKKKLFDIKKGQNILVQITKEPYMQKGAGLTTYVSLAGRNIIYLPNSVNNAGISKKVFEPEERNIVRAFLSKIDFKDGESLIVRTEGAKNGEVSILKDLENLREKWQTIKEKSEKKEAPSLIHSESSLLLRIVRDIFRDEIKKIIVAGKEVCKKIKNHAKQVEGFPENVIKLYLNKKKPIFSKHNLEDQIKQLYEPLVKLPSGGSLIFSSTEALVSIDVNSSKSRGERNLEETILKTNLEAAIEVPRHLQLRGLSGTIVIDFISMDSEKANLEIEAAIKEAFSKDRAKVEIGKITKLGLLEISRQRLRNSFLETVMEPCKFCNGKGYKKTLHVLIFDFLRDLENFCFFNKQEKVGYILAKVPKEIVVNIFNYNLALFQKIKNNFEIDIKIELHDLEETWDFLVVEKEEFLC